MRRGPDTCIVMTPVHSPLRITTLCAVLLLDVLLRIVADTRTYVAQQFSLCFCVSENFGLLSSLRLNSL